MGERSGDLRRMGAGLGMIVAGGLLVAGVLPGAAAADEAEPPTGTPVEGNPTCADLGEFDSEFKIDGQPEAGQAYEDPNSDFEVTITDVGDGDPMTVSFEANMPVAAVFVKAGPGGLLYVFEPPSTTGTDLVSPKDSISHLSFCWNEDQRTTTTTEHETTTTTEHETTTTTKVDGTTTTTGHDTTTTSQVSGTTPTTQPGQSTTTAPDVEGTTPSTQPTGAEGELPRTGTNTGLLLAAAAGLVACGGALVVATRRMRRA
jgi:LPXTG-motif cell wall-anchored protein